MSCPMCEKKGVPGASALTEEEKKNGVRIALAGNPNCGKTTAFNAWTGAHQHVGNYPGVTVEKKEAGPAAASKKCCWSICRARIRSRPIPWKSAWCATCSPPKTPPNAPAR